MRLRIWQGLTGSTGAGESPSRSGSLKKKTKIGVRAETEDRSQSTAIGGTGGRGENGCKGFWFVGEKKKVRT